MKTRQPRIGDAINWEHAVEFSYAAYHAEAISYVCLFRSTVFTVKAYFFDNGSNDKVVVPHTHRYDFDTKVVAGHLSEVRYRLSKSPFALSVNQYRYESIVDGGSGFSFDGTSPIIEMSEDIYTAETLKDSYRNRAHRDIHTLRNVKPGTMLLLTQYADQGPKRTYAWSDSQPETNGIYLRMERPEIERRVEQLHEAMRWL